MLSALRRPVCALLLVVLLGRPAARAEGPAPRVARPRDEPWSDGATLVLKRSIREAIQQGRGIRTELSRARVRKTVLEAGARATIPTSGDTYNTLVGSGGHPGAIAELRQALEGGDRKRPGHRYALVHAALGSRARLRKLLDEQGITGQDRARLAELVLWRMLAYNSSTLAHGSVSPTGAEDEIAKGLARRGLAQAVRLSFTLGDRLAARVGARERAPFFGWGDVQALHAEAIKDFPDKEPGQVRTVNFDWPYNSFGVDWPQLHGPNGQVGRFGRMLDGLRADRHGDDPLRGLSRALYWIHNVHPFRDGNGRTQILTGWVLARAGGFPLPLHYDMSAADFKLASTKLGGTSNDLRALLARGAVRSERYARDLLPVLGGRRIVSMHTDRGAVGAVLEPKGGGPRALLVSMPVTHAVEDDPELAAERRKERAVVIAPRFEQRGLRLEYSVNGKHNAWRSVAPSAHHVWDRRYPWWSTVEPFFQLELPADARYVDFRLKDASGRAIGAEGYYMDLGRSP